ncbi:MAG: DUF2235 domain-containing protein [Bradyrhizobium sp.]|uniref:DUF2235 domain-containing protein n=1 Tax=Bradyrhizobium sp. TaxID=376 RepID=UPI001D6D588E|nr:DUF2235 domain-containing protein [Bradyrhizobium sp.]MBV9563028.1 DUF2235 domain-containing protein [Bradyrhizobium sp.]
MKRIIILIDGTWNDEGKGNDTNIAKLDPNYEAAGAPLIKPVAADGTEQRAFYHDGVGNDPDLLKRLLGGAIGIGLRKIVQEGYQKVVENYALGDQIFILGFSRGAYAARALAGLIGASGLQRTPGPNGFDVVWNHFRVAPEVRAGAKPASSGDQKAIDSFQTAAAQNAVDPAPRVRCVGVFDTVGSYGVPAGIGLAALGRYFTLAFLGFHDTEIGRHVDFGLHAVAVDERRRPFVPTFWTAPKGQPPLAHVEQTWFAGVHCNIGGGYPDAGLSDRALIWMIARLQALTGLEFDVERVKAVTRPNIDGEVVDSAKGWIVDETFPYGRIILSPDAIEHGAFMNRRNPAEEHVNERVHWSAIEKRGRKCTVFGVRDTPYAPSNMPMPADIRPDQIAEITAEESALLGAAGAAGHGATAA